VGENRVREEEPQTAVGSRPVPVPRDTGSWMPGIGGNAMWSDLAHRGDGPHPALLSDLAAYGGNAALARAVGEGQGDPAGPASLPPGRYTVVVVGSPGPGELPGHAFQFADAGARVAGEQRVWLVERTGYELGKVDLAGIAARAKGAPVFWITPGAGLSGLLGQFPAGSIVGLHVFSHGVPGQLTLRYGWDEADNYGLSLAEARTLTPQAFAADADVSFDSCNTGTDPSLLPGLGLGERSLAAEVADATERPVTAWSGRTSYRQVNRGIGGVTGSEIFGGGWRPDMTEVYSSVIRQRVPQQYATAPARSAGDWSSWFRMTARLPETRKFPVPANGTVTATITARSEYLPMQGADIAVILHREVDWGADEDFEGKPGAVVGKESVITWSGLAEGTYYLELFHLSGLEVEGGIAVTIR
jgi:hypothetical protein